MNTITHEGNDYEVLSLDRISEITHAKLAGGKVVDARNTGFIEIQTAHAEMILDSYELEDLGIQPLKLLEKVPVEFVATFAKIGHEWHPVYNLDEGLAQQGREQKEFRCGEVTK